MGLGLTISSMIIKQMGGHISLESTPNVGSKFFFTIPILNDELDGLVTSQSLIRTDTTDAVTLHRRTGTSANSIAAYNNYKSLPMNEVKRHFFTE